MRIEPFSTGRRRPGTGRSRVVSARLKGDTFDTLADIADEHGTTAHDLARQVVEHFISTYPRTRHGTDSKQA